MKTTKLFVIAVFAIVIGSNVSAQTHDMMNMNMAATKNESLKVWGNCDLCKARIEKTVKAEGATNADWNAETKILTVTFDPTKTSIDTFSKRLAKVGHDTEKYRADDQAYTDLDSCCKYPRKK